MGLRGTGYYNSRTRGGKALFSLMNCNKHNQNNEVSERIGRRGEWCKGHIAPDCRDMPLPLCSFLLVSDAESPDQTLNRKLMISPSFTSYVFPSSLKRPLSRAADMLPEAMKSS